MIKNYEHWDSDDLRHAWEEINTWCIRSVNTVWVWSILTVERKAITMELMKREIDIQKEYKCVK